MADDSAGSGGGAAGRRAAREGGSVPAERERLVELEVGRVAHGGSCVARAEGRVVFVRHALPGERVRARVTDRSHDRYWRADAVEILEPSPDRVAPPCPHAGPRRASGAAGQAALGGCGGCDWQHATLAAQRRLKAQVVAEALRRQGGLSAHVVGEDEKDQTEATGLAIAVEPLPGPGLGDGLGWRTRMRFAVTPAGEVGLRAHRSHEVLATPDCRIAHPLVVAAVAGKRFADAEAVEVAASVSS
ncbi:TRAM domain-containing protein, partial [Frankia sp. AgB1.8]